jgi:uncharacterized protein (DUF433 family)
LTNLCAEADSNPASPQTECRENALAASMQNRQGASILVGTRTAVATIVADLAAGASVEALGEAYRLTREQVLTALRHAAHLAAHFPPVMSEAS